MGEHLPADWPTVLPNYHQHPVGRYGGLRGWAAALPGDGVWDFVRDVLRLPVGETPPAHAWCKPVSTYALYLQYEGASRVDKERFAASIRWADSGVAPPPPSTPRVIGGVAGDVNQRGGGFCYLCVYRTEARPAARARLGANPWAGALVADMLDHAGELSDSRFKVSLREGTVDRDHSRAFRQAHIEAADDGMRLRDLPSCLTAYMRVGAALGEVSSLLQPQAMQTVPAGGSLYDNGGVSRTTIKVGVWMRVAQDKVKWPGVKFNIMASPVFAMLTAPYESVRLEAVEFSLTVDPGDTNAVWCAITTPATNLNSDMDWLASPSVQIVRSVESGVAGGMFKLPEDTSFSRELKANLPGNTPPVFQFGYVGVAGTAAEIIGHVTLSMAGVGVMGHINVGGTGKSALMSVGQVVQSSRAAMGYSMDTTAPETGSVYTAVPDLLEMFGIEDEDEDDEEAAPVARRSPPAGR